MNNTAKQALLVGGDLAQRTATLLGRQHIKCFGLRRTAANRHTPGLHWLQADLTEPESLRSLPGPFSHLLYAVTPDERNEQAYLRAYVQGLKNLLDALDTSQLKRAVFVSSTAVYGPDTGWVNEDTPTEPEGFNGKVLLQAEQLFHERLGDKAVVIRLSGIYGPERTQLLRRLRSGAVASDPQTDQWTNRIHIDDAAGACAHLLTLNRAEATYIGTDDSPTPMSTLYGELARMLGNNVSPAKPVDYSQLGGKRLSNQRLKNSGYTFKWPDSLQGYRAIVQTDEPQ